MSLLISTATSPSITTIGEPLTLTANAVRDFLFIEAMVYNFSMRNMSEVHLKKVHSIITSGGNPENICRDIIKAFTLDENLSEKLFDDSALESQVYTLAVRYLDKDYHDMRDVILNELRTIIH